MSIISFYLYAYFKKSKYLILISMHTFFVLLTGSFSAIGTYLIVLSIMSFHYRIFKFINIVKLLCTLLIISIILQDFISTETIFPLNLDVLFKANSTRFTA